MLNPRTEAVELLARTRIACAPVRDALAAEATETGCTIHWVDEGVDTGQIIAQEAVAIQPGDDEARLHERIKILERKLIVEVVRKLEGRH